jgi:hypothetical protein
VILPRNRLLLLANRSTRGSVILDATELRRGAPALHVVRDTAPPEEREPLRGYTTEDIESFKKLGVEVCLSSESFGELWLVPEYTGHDRKELTPEHAATISRVLEAFPGSRVVSFEKSPKPKKEADA